MTAAANKLGQSLRPSNAVELGKIRIKLLNAGFRHEQAVTVYYGVKFIGLLLGLIVAFPPCAIRMGMCQTTYLWTMGAGGLGFYLPDVVLNMKKKKRSEAIFLGLPDALDLMVVCVEAGLGLDAAMRRVTNELTQSCPIICEEFAIANFQIQMGRTRRDVLRDLGTQHRRRRRAKLGSGDHSGREVRLEHFRGLAQFNPMRCGCAAASWRKNAPPRPRSRSCCR